MIQTNNNNTQHLLTAIIKHYFTPQSFMCTLERVDDTCDRYSISGKVKDGVGGGNIQRDVTSCLRGHVEIGWETFKTEYHTHIIVTVSK